MNRSPLDTWRPNDKVGDLARLGDHRQIAGVELDRGGVHVFRHESLELRRNGPIVAR